MYTTSSPPAGHDQLMSLPHPLPIHPVKRKDRTRQQTGWASAPRSRLGTAPAPPPVRVVPVLEALCRSLPSVPSTPSGSTPAPSSHSVLTPSSHSEPPPSSHSESLQPCASRLPGRGSAQARSVHSLPVESTSVDVRDSRMAGVHLLSVKSCAIEVFRAVRFPPVKVALPKSPHDGLQILPSAAVLEKVLPSL
jgi:hypothetical protein